MYPIVQDFLPVKSKRRSGRKISKVLFLVAHDTGNKNSTARNNVDYYKRTAFDQSASAHIFVDDKQIIECIPAFSYPEKAWHVLYNLPHDNRLFGADANDCAIGVEYCFGDNINADEAYKKYVWTLAKLCYVYKLSPKLHIPSHQMLDPRNRSDPQNGLSRSGRSYKQLLEDVSVEYDNILRRENKPVSGVFKDVPDEHYAKKAIEFFGKQGIIVGDGKGNFMPTTNITRADNALILYNTLVKLNLIKEG